MKVVEKDAIVGGMLQDELGLLQAFFSVAFLVNPLMRITE
jgi:hypothetical protein